MTSISAFEILCGIAALFLAIYHYLTSTYDFWKSRGVPGPKPIPVFGNLKDVMLGRVHPAQLTKNLYDEYNDAPVVGIFNRRTPILLIRDLELIKHVLIRDFSQFISRGVKIYEKIEPLTATLFSLEPERWRPLRSKLSSMFTSGKLKQMFYLLSECADDFEKFLDAQVAKGEPIDCREITARFNTDVIGSCAFGLKMNAMSDEESEFRRMGRKMFTVTTKTRLRNIIKEATPWLYPYVADFFKDKEFSTFFLNCVKETLECRKKANEPRHDFIDLLLELKEHPEKLPSIELTDHFLAAQAVVFFAAGFETSSTTVSHALYLLAQHHDIQNKLREEIRAELKKDKVLTYDGVKNMKYLDMVLNESMRMYPPGAVLVREAGEDYTLPGTKITIPKGLKVWIPVYGIHRDPNLYPNPDVFDPERFNEEAVKSRNTASFMPFGDGPRNCIGARFAVNQSKMGLIKILANHKVDVCEKTQIPYVMHPTNLVMTLKQGIYLKISKVD